MILVRKAEHVQDREFIVAAFQAGQRSKCLEAVDVEQWETIEVSRIR
jgi:hypothetical protein